MRAAPLIALAACAACVTGGTRTIRPVAEELIQASERVTLTAALQAITDRGLPLRESNPDAGIIETDYVDMASYYQEATYYPFAERIVRFRVLVTDDPQSGDTRLAIQGIYSPFSTGLSNTRRNERAIPRDHPAMQLVRSLVDHIREIAEGG